MLKLLLILGITVYLLYKVGSFFFRAGAAAQQLRDLQDKQRKGPTAPPRQKAADSSKFSGGDYIDYEEVKK